MNTDPKNNSTHFPKRIFLHLSLDNGTDLAFQSWPLHHANILVFACRLPGKGRRLKLPKIPKSWIIRVDPGGSAWDKQEKHYHC